MFAHRQNLVVRGTGNGPIDVGELAAVGLIPGPDAGRGVVGGVCHASQCMQARNAVLAGVLAQCGQYKQVLEAKIATGACLVADVAMVLLNCERDGYGCTKLCEPVLALAGLGAVVWLQVVELQTGSCHAASIEGAGRNAAGCAFGRRIYLGQRARHGQHPAG